MTDPVILLGTQSNGETLPVQVDGFGRLVAEGLQGSEGPPGEQGPPGADGGSFPLPPDPYEGAFLGWLNNELAWIGSPPVPIPPGRFGPITAWDAESGLLTVQGEIPVDVGSGVYVWQCNEDGTYFTEGWNTTRIWSDGVTFSGNILEPGTKAFDGNPATSAAPYDAGGGGGTPQWIEVTFSPGLPYTTSVRVERKNGNANDVIVSMNGGNPINSVWQGFTTVATGSGTLTSIKVQNNGSSNTAGISRIEVDGKILVDNDLSLNLRVNSVLGQSLLGIPSATVDFTIGKYLRVPEQRVAPWVLYGNDPTSLIDHLRSS